jgi:hypothetical protein
MSNIRSKSLTVIIFTFIVLIITIAIFQITAAVNLKSIKNYTAENHIIPSFSVTANDGHIKSQPMAFAIPKANINKGEEVKIVSHNKKWCKIIYYKNNTVKTGYLHIEDIMGINDETFETGEIIDNSATPSPEKLSFSSAKYKVDKDSTLDLTKQLEVTDNADIKWTTSNPEIVTVENGKISGKNEGSAVIYATSGGKTAHCMVDVRAMNNHAKGELKMKNAYGNNINYHPSVLYFKDGWNGYKYWLAHTPYERCNDYWENPHIMASNDLSHWEAPNCFENPLEAVPDDYEYGISYNSDTELVYNSDTDTLECWWRNYHYTTLEVSLRRRTTSDGVHWTDTENMLVFNLKKEDFLSPAILYENGMYKMWSINHKSHYDIEYRESKDGKQWSKKRKIELEYEDPKYINWHLDVIHTPKGYEMDISAFLKGTRDHTVMPLFYSYSPDNVTWTKARIMLTPGQGANDWDNKGLYRSCLLYADDKYYLFYSGINKKTGPVGIGMISGDNVFHMN